jgi:hypothetical protein
MPAISSSPAWVTVFAVGAAIVPLPIAKAASRRQAFAAALLSNDFWIHFWSRAE